MKIDKKSKNIRLSVMGGAGRMGTRIINLAEEDPRFQVVAGVELPDSPAVGHFAGKGKAPIVGSLNEVLLKTDVVIDFTSPEAVLQTAEVVSKHNRAIIIGTTGLKSAAIKQLETLAKKIPIVFAPNMSVGMNLLFRLVQEAARALSHYDIEIVEAHHNKKKDSPSGTAMELAAIAAKASSRSPEDFVYGRQGLTGERKKKEIGILAVRAGDIVGDHTVMLSGGGERLELIHRAHSRDAFAAGALTAAAWIHDKRPGLYNMHDVLGLK